MKKKSNYWAQRQEALAQRLLVEGGLVTVDETTRNDRGAYRGCGFMGIHMVWVFEPKAGLQLAKEIDNTTHGGGPNNYGGNFPYETNGVNNIYPEVSLPYGRELVVLYHEAHCCHDNVCNVRHWGLRLSVLQENGASWRTDVFVDEAEFNGLFARLEEKTLEAVHSWEALLRHPLLWQLLCNGHGKAIKEKFQPGDFELAALASTGVGETKDADGVYGFTDKWERLGGYEPTYSHPATGTEMPSKGDILTIVGEEGAERRLVVGISNPQPHDTYWYVIVP